MTPSRSQRRSAFLLVVPLATALAAAPHAAAQQPDADMLDRMIAYSQCIRDNGYAEFPDPGPDGRLQFRLQDPSSAPRFQAAREACQDKAPFGVASGPPDPEQMERLVRFAQCVRDNGVAEFPDPNAQGQFSLSGASVDIEGPTMQTAMQTCTQAGGGPGGGGGVMIRITP